MPLRDHRPTPLVLKLEKAAAIALLVLGCYAIFWFCFSYITKEQWDDLIIRPKKILIVGGGLAGLSAAVEANKKHARITIVEKEPKFGGNSAKASSGINALNTFVKMDDHDSFELFYNDTIKSGDGLSDETLASVLVSSSYDAWQFLNEYQIDLSNLSQCGGHSKARTHRGWARTKPENIGYTITKKIEAYICKRENVFCKTNTEALKLMKEGDGRVVGALIKHEDGEEVHELFDEVILTTGGFAADQQGFLYDYAPEKANLATTNGQFAKGDGIRMAVAVGADTVHMDKVQLHPTGFVKPSDPLNPSKFLAPEALRGSGGILVDGEGRRFFNELGRRDHVTEAIFKNCKPFTDEKDSPVSATLILSSKGAEKFNPSILAFYTKMGLVNEYPSISEAAKKLDLPELEATVEEYNTYAKGEKEGPDAFGKTVFPTEFDSNPVKVMSITPVLHYTMGGVRFDYDGRVLRADGSHVQGLWAAGEVTGGLHGNNRLAGNSLLDCVVFGRRVGEVAGHPDCSFCSHFDKHVKPLIDEYVVIPETKKLYGQLLEWLTNPL